jgi:hypothetical protein
MQTLTIFNAIRTSFTAFGSRTLVVLTAPDTVETTRTRKALSSLSKRERACGTRCLWLKVSGSVIPLVGRSTDIVERIIVHLHNNPVVSWSAEHDALLVIRKIPRLTGLKIPGPASGNITGPVRKGDGTGETGRGAVAARINGNVTVLPISTHRIIAGITTSVRIWRFRASNVLPTLVV